MSGCSTAMRSDRVALAGEELRQEFASHSLVIRDGLDVDEFARQVDCVNGHVSNRITRRTWGDQQEASGTPPGTLE